MSLLLDDLLDVSRITHGTLQLRKQQTDLQSIVGAAVETARPLIDERRHQLIDRGARGPAGQRGSAASRAGAVESADQRREVHQSARLDPRSRRTQSGDELVIAVEDSGIGIAARGPAEGVRHVRAGALGAGSRGRRSGNRPGARERYCRAARRPHRSGERAAPGKGSRFTVRLPNVVTQRRRGRERRASSRNGACGANKRILLADDNRDAAESLAIILRLEGHEVELAHDGVAALRALRRRAGPTSRCSTSACPRRTATKWRGSIRARPEGDGGAADRDHGLGAGFRQGASHAPPASIIT